MIASKYPNDAAIQQAVYNAAEEWVFREQMKKLLLFAEAISADLTTLTGSFRTYLRLVETYPQALKVVEPGSERRPGAPRKPRSKDAPSCWIELVREVDIQLAVAEALGTPSSIAKVCHDLSKRGRRNSKNRWHAYEDGTLETYYHQHKAALQRRSAMLDKGPTEYWKYLEAAAENAKPNNGLLPRKQSSFH